MIKIALCDDNPEELALISAFLNDFKKEYPQYPFTVDSYREPFALLERAEAIGGCDLYLLDIVMPGVSGVRCAEELRLRNDSCEIVFLTASNEYGAEAFALRASDYLLKPIGREAFSACLRSAFERLVKRCPPLPIKLAGGELRKIRPTEIVCIESFSHYQEIRLANGDTLKCSGTLAELSRQLAAPNFYAPHRAYLVNFDYVTGITKQGISAGGRLVPIPRGTMKAVQQSYLDYLLNK